MAAPFVTTRRVEFADTDLAGIMHFTGFFRMMEEAEHELLRQLGLGVVHRDAAGEISWPRVSSACDFRAPARFEELLEIEVSVAELSEKSATYQFVFRRDGQTLAEGRMTSVCCRIGAEGPQSIPIPDDVRGRLAQASP